MALVSSVRSSVPADCLVRKCRRDGCSVSMAKVPQPFVLVDVDCPGLGIASTASRCDFVFACDAGNRVAALELKAGALRASDVVIQLRAGAQFAAGIVPQNEDVQFFPIAVVGGKIHPSELGKLRHSNSQVRFRDRSVSIQLLRCGQSIANAFDKAI